MNKGGWGIEAMTVFVKIWHTGSVVSKGVVVVEEPVIRLPQIKPFPPQTVANLFKTFR